MGRVDSKVAFVTGAGQGIGQAIAVKLGAEGARIVVNDLDADLAAGTVAKILEAGGDAIAFPGSVTEDGFAEAYIDAGFSKWGGVDIIVNNAGYTWDSVIHKMADDQFDAMLDVHLKAPFRILRAASEPIRILSKQDAQEGRRNVRKIVNISSTSGTMGNPGQVNYSSAKAGILGLTKTLAKEWGRYGVAVNCVAFAYIQTRLTSAVEGEKPTINIDGNTVSTGIPAANIQALERAIPMGRGGTPEEAAGAVYLFCCPESDYVSGQTIVCGGGFGSTA